MAAAGIIGRRPRANRASRRKNPVSRPQPTAPIRIESVAFAGLVATVVFDQAVALNGVPQYATDLAGVTPVSAALTSPTTVAITYSATVATAGRLDVPYEEPAVRNSSGGFVSTSQVVI